MTALSPEELQKVSREIEQIYTDAMAQLNALESDKKEIIKEYIKELEQQKLKLIKQHLNQPL